MNERRNVSGWMMSKIGRALSIFGVSSPEDLAAQKRADAFRKQPRTAANLPANPADPSDQTTIEQETPKTAEHT